MQETSQGRPACLPLTLDLAERAALAGFFGLMAWSLFGTWRETGNPVTLILLVSEGSVVVFALVRRFATEVTLRPIEWLIPILGTIAPLSVQPVAAEPLASVLLCVPLMLVGLGLQMAAKLTLRRSFGVVPANRGVKVGGPYRFVRHPMYAGYIMTQIGFLLTYPSAWNGSVYLIALSLQLYRILAEERLLGRDAAYRNFSALVPYRLVPGVF
jgi:protein-S-isoprenylcysteine O-methyltransferase Ste14